MEIISTDPQSSAFDLSRFSFRNSRSILDVMAQMYYLGHELHSATVDGHSVKDTAIEEQGVCSLEDLKIRLEILAKRRGVLLESLQSADVSIVKQYAQANYSSSSVANSRQKLRLAYTDPVYACCFDAIDFVGTERKLRKQNFVQKKINDPKDDLRLADPDWWK